MNVTTNRDILSFIVRSKLGKPFYQHLPRSVVAAISEIAHNIVEQTTTLTEDERSYLSRNIKLVQKLARKRTPLKEKKIILGLLHLKFILQPALRRFQHGNQDEASTSRMDSRSI